ncbi:MAG: PilT/PilU family type 4a pilus ATPase [Fusobacteriaceae bacterium]|nr:PilT/PilU family type 4a pilus ATPase [Fusobacteriaceae bacterium]
MVEIDFQRVLEIGRQKGASDVHILQDEFLTYRINGKIVKDENFKITKKDTDFIVSELLNESKREKFKKEKELDIAYENNNKNRYRINLHYQKGSVGISIRILKDEIMTIDNLNLPIVVKKMIENRNGLVLVSGATGSGKSTTLAAMVEEINKMKNLNIVTIEDPIEYVFQSKNSIVRQREIGADTNSFKNALKSVLRQDPDVILIGEMRDLESIEMAITVAETGHLVLGTLHTIGAIECIDRIIDAFPKEKQNQVRLQISNVLRGVINQQLISGVDGKIVLACEILINTPAVANYILSGKTNQISSIIESNQKLGMISMRKYVENLYKDGKISEEEYIRAQ